MLRVHRQYSSGTAAGQRLLFGGMYGQKGYAKEQPVPVACGVHSQDERVHMVRYAALPEMLLGGLAHMISGELHEQGRWTPTTCP